jgi:peptidyl-prolyl cis-trans isomerase C
MARLVVLAKFVPVWVRRNPIVPSGTRGMLVSLLALVLVALGSGTALATDRMFGVPRGAVLRLGNTVLTAQQLDTHIKLYRLILGLTPPTDPAQIDQFHRAVAKAVATELVIDDVAKARNIVIADKTANDRLTEMLERSFPEGRDEFTARLAAAGVPESEMIEAIKRQIATGQIFDQVTKDVPAPTDQDLALTYQQRKAEMVIPEKRHIRNIAVATQDQADQVADQLAHGADFADLAVQLSEDNETKGNGGDLGSATRAQIKDEAFGDAAFAAAPNSVFGPVHTNGIWDVGQVLEVTQPVPLSLDQIRDQLRADLLDQRQSQAWNRWVSDQLNNADVKYAEAYRPADPTGTPPSLDQPGGVPTDPGAPR